ncbi:MAG: galactonate dehydratase [Paucimonas sp.]|nr:galactonate dehydratase [Paucimonas sp.]
MMAAAPGQPAGRRHIVVDGADNVATLLDTEEGLALLAGGAPCAAGIPFGHKVALRPIGAGEAVIKYGVTIGRAIRPIAAGEHVHVHNCS